VATGEDVREELPADVRLALTPETGNESPDAKSASLFEEPSLSPHEKQIYRVLKADEALHLNEIIEKLELELSSSKIFAALFELGLPGKVKQLRGKNFVRSF
jgi:DNA processing protein